MISSLKHAKIFAEYLSRCDSSYIIRLAVKELGVPNDCDGYQYIRNTVAILERDPCAVLENGVYIEFGKLRYPAAGNDEVRGATNWAIRKAWVNRNEELWRYYFPVGHAGVTKCPTNREFLMAIVDFVELWIGCCEEVAQERTK